MTLDVFLRLLKQHLIWFILFPCLTAATAWYVTRNQPKLYKSQTALYTGLATGYSLMSDKQAGFSDRSAYAFDNLLNTLYSKETLLQVGESLLTDHLQLTQPDSLNLRGVGFHKLQQAIPDFWRQTWLPNNDPVRLRSIIDSLAKTPTDNPVKNLLLTADSYYSVTRLTDKLKASPRKGTNDVLLMEYESDDPGVAQRTLKYAIEVLNKRNSYFKTAETNSVVDYYEIKLQRAKEALDKAEMNLRAFSAKHKVLDYEEEARTVAASREALKTEYNQELMRRNAAKASIETLKRRSGQQSTIRTANNDLNERQKKLTEAENQLANARAYGQSKAELSRLQAKVSQAAEDLRLSAQKYDAVTNATESVPQQTIGNDLLNKTLEYDESEARLSTYQQRMDEYQAKTNEYGPLGSELRELNRAMSVAEKGYLDLLQNVDQSRLRRQDVSIGGRLEVVDAPDFPLLPQPSKRGQLIAIGFGVGIFLALLLTALRFWADKRIQSPEQAESLTGIPVTSLFPTVNNPLVYSKTSWAALCMFEQLSNAINIELAQVRDKPYPPTITLFSIRPRQGKSWVAEGLIRLYTDVDQKVAYCYPRVTGKEKREDNKSITFLPYTLRPDFMNVTGVDYLLDLDYNFEAAHYERIILELPPLNTNQIPVYLLKESALSLLVVDASSAWARAEKQLLSLYKRVTNQPILLLLNRVGGDHIVIPERTGKKQAAGRVTRSQPTSQS